MSMWFHFSVISLLKLNCLTTLIFVYSLEFSSAGNNETDRSALREFKASITNDTLGILNSWNDSLHFCHWQGVTCGRRNHRVTALHLPSSKLRGTLSPFIGNFTFLVELNLFHNTFTGIIPPQIGRLQMLQHLNMSSNSFQGEITANLSHCSSLVLLGLSSNELVGEIPPALGSLKSLQRLAIGENNLAGVIPPSLGNLTSLLRLYLNGNNLTGAIPESLGRLDKLLVLALGVNKLSGVVPPSIFNLSLLTVLDLGYNHFLEGTLPLHIGTMLPNLQFFSIYGNKFTGSIPASISNCSNLDRLQLSSNSLQGPVPCLQNLRRLTVYLIYDSHLGLGKLNDLDFLSCLANSTMLEVLDIEANNFQGAFPRIVCNFSKLSVFLSGDNKIVGKIPNCIENLAKLTVFQAHNNTLSGGIPANIGKLQSLVVLYLLSNELSGNIPSSIGNLTQLGTLVLGDNNLKGQIPSTLGKCMNLQDLDISQNNLVGRIPPQLFSLSLLIELHLSQNPLNGSLPKEVGQLKNVVVLDISQTRLSGEIPSALGDCLPLKSLDMRGNRFQGAIPSSFAALRGLQELDLSENNLSGQVPNFLEDLPLKMLNLSYNNLEGKVPIGGVFNNKSGISIVGNRRLCGGMRELNLASCSFKKGGKGRFRGKKRLIIALVSGVFGFGLMFVACVSLYLLCFRQRKMEHECVSKNSRRNLSYGDILKATNGFSSENVVGSGAFGTVYKAILDQGLTVFAIKTFKLVQKGAYKSFMAECQILKNVRHRNLLKVITACSSVDYKGNDFKALVYEYMPNGSLEDWLHQKRTDSVEETSASLRSLNLLQRVDIAVDVASALDYLHYHCGASIIHCDLKPSNILLDNDMVAHVGDFGLAKFLSNGTTSARANESSSIGVRGTIGYASPEYGIGNEPSTHGDVYSFGILMLEMFTGKKPTDDRFEEGLSLHGYVKGVWPELVTEIVDDVILEDIVGEVEMNTHTIDQTHYLLRTGKSKRMLEAVTSILGIALSCSVEFPRERMDMRNVAVKLSEIRNKLHGARLPR